MIEEDGTRTETGRLRVRIIGVPMDLGAGRRGVDMGPSAIRIGGLHAKLRRLNVDVEESGNLDVKVPEEVDCGTRDRMYLGEIGHVCTHLASRVRESLENGKTPLVLGGDHSLAAGSVAGVSLHYRERKQKIGLIWIDAHTDINTPETSRSGNVHGMPLGALLGLGPEPLSRIGGLSPKLAVENLVLVGTRSIDRAEKEIIQRQGVRVMTMKEIDMRGMTSVMEEALESASSGTAGYYCSFDLDAVDPHFAPGVGTPVPGGISYRESHLAMEMIHDSARCLALELVEVNPILDTENRTGLLAVELACSALGQRIL